MPRKSIVWTQMVKSKHRKNSHHYYHEECWDAMFIEVPDDDEARYSGDCDNCSIDILIKWALRVG